MEKRERFSGKREKCNLEKKSETDGKEREFFKSPYAFVSSEFAAAQPP